MLHRCLNMLHFNTMQHDSQTFSQTISQTLRVCDVRHGDAVNGTRGTPTYIEAGLSLFHTPGDPAKSTFVLSHNTIFPANHDGLR